MAKQPGRPIAASDAQQIAVRKMRKAGASLRKIARDTSLGLQTVRTILGRPAGKDRTGKRRAEFRRLELNRACKRIRDALPK